MMSSGTVFRGLNSFWKNANSASVGLMTNKKREVHLGVGSTGKFIPTKITLDKGREVKWCSCGTTKKQPFCDGSSSCNGKPVSFKALETREYAFCNCKNSNNKPFCDGTHAN